MSSTVGTDQVIPNSDAGELKVQVHHEAPSAVLDSPLMTPSIAVHTETLDHHYAATPLTTAIVPVEEEEVTAVEVPPPDPASRCVNKPDEFCYICGRAIFKKHRCAIFERCHANFFAYFGRSMENLDAWWTPNFICNSCHPQLFSWATGRSISGLPFGIPMLWAEPQKEDHSDCYFCAFTTKQVFGMAKTRSKWAYPDDGPLVVTLPIGHSDILPVPPCPTQLPFQAAKPLAKTTIRKINASGPEAAALSRAESKKKPNKLPAKPTTAVAPIVESSDEVVFLEGLEGAPPSEIYLTEPQLYSQDDLEGLMKDLAPLTERQKEILTDSLKKRHLIRARQTRTQAAGKRKSYAFALPSPKKKRQSALRAPKYTDDYETGDDNDLDADAEIFSSSSSESDYSDCDSDFEITAKEETMIRGNRERVLTLSLNCLVEGCKAKVADRGELDVHLEKVHSVQKYRCLVLGCAASFRTQREFKGHNALQHPDATTWPCGRCQLLPFPSYNKLKNHIVHNHCTGTFRCGHPDCNFEQVDSTSLKMVSHYNYAHAHSNTVKNFICPWEDCKAAFTTDEALMRHEKRHTGEKPYACDLCGRAFAEEKRLAVHKRIHTGDLPFSCTICGRSYLLKGSLDFHAIKHGEKTCKCHQCGKAFYYPRSLERHLVSHKEGGNQVPCPSCGKTYTTRSNMLIHLNKICLPRKRAEGVDDVAHMEEAIQAVVALSKQPLEEELEGTIEESIHAVATIGNEQLDEAQLGGTVEEAFFLM